MEPWHFMGKMSFSQPYNKFTSPADYKQSGCLWEIEMMAGVRAKWMLLSSGGITSSRVSHKDRIGFWSLGGYKRLRAWFSLAYLCWCKWGVNPLKQAAWYHCERDISELRIRPSTPLARGSHFCSRTVRILPLKTVLPLVQKLGSCSTPDSCIWRPNTEA